MTTLYWFRDSSCKDPATDGWVGVTEDLDQRVRVHRNQPAPSMMERCTDINLCTAEVLFEDPRDECLAREAILRPGKDIGWNHMQGGFARPATPRKRNTLKNPRVRIAVKKTKSTATVSTRLTLEERAKLETISANTGKSPCEMVRMFVLAGMGLPTNNIPTRNRWKPTAEISKVAA
jgi:hypothetical protein